jgi:hypothetical protein
LDVARAVRAAEQVAATAALAQIEAAQADAG